ncbi:oligopeptide ABC transporter permease [Tepidibacillus decaturensis]|uniref:Peptide ABC transporter permease n=1 Tax=Tepidibacillus decaturensis TaxID=1413211 RepID=A0A135L4A5_9BACI|nr:oligopeptide ABC transporter permease [Tepidibacillus decaturensis]KXG43845.1 peptide ABC transporter permease [Tepidibacillus decaturensis]
MLTYTLRRLAGMIPLLILVSIVVFSLAKMMPGDALSGRIDPNNSDPKYIAEMREKLGLNDPVYIQYARWVKNMLKGDFGESFIHKMPVSELLGQRILNTLFLALLSLFITYFVAFFMGMYAGKHPYTLGDHFIATFNYLAFAIPSFFAALVAIYIFAIQLGWVPASGTIDTGIGDGGTFIYFLSKLKHTILPAMVLGMLSTAAYTQFLRNDIIESSRKDYVRTARAKGTKESVIYNKHILRNSIIPLITFLGFDIGGLLGGAVITETIFTYPGIGQLFIDSVSNRDYSVMMTITMMLSVMTLLGNLIADLLYGVVDPRIRLD